MQININTDKTIERHSGLDEHVETVVKSAIARFGEQISRIEVHLSDDLSQKSADGNNRCMLEARVTNYQPIGGAADKLKRALDSALGRLHDKQLHKTPTLIDEEV